MRLTIYPKGGTRTRYKSKPMSMFAAPAVPVALSRSDMNTMYPPSGEYCAASMPDAKNLGNTMLYGTLCLRSTRAWHARVGFRLRKLLPSTYHAAACLIFSH